MQYRLSNSQGQLCQVAIDSRLTALATASLATTTSTDNTHASTTAVTDGRHHYHHQTSVPLTVHSASTRYATDISGRSSVLCSFQTVKESDRHSNSKSYHTVSWIVTVRGENNKELILVWYPQLEASDKNGALISELNNCIVPAYLCHHSYSWYVSDNIEEAVPWCLSSQVTDDNKNTSHSTGYKLIDDKGASISITPSL